MKTLVLAALSLALALPASAASAPKKAKPKTRTLKSLADIAMASGSPSDCPDNVFPELGIGTDALSNGRLPQKSVSYKQKISPDGQKHIFSVAYKHDSEKGTDTPLFYLWDVFKARQEGSDFFADGYSLKVSIDGKLQAIVSIKGPVSDGKHSVIDKDIPESKRAYEHELEFYTRTSIPLEMTK